MQIGQTGVFQAAASAMNDPAEVSVWKGGRNAEATGNNLPQDTTSFSTASIAASSADPAIGPIAKAFVQQSMATAPARSARVVELQQAVATDSYALDAGSIADAMIRTIV